MPGDGRSDGPSTEITDLAEGCVRFVRKALGIELDYTGDTLPILDHYVRSQVDTPGEELVALLAPTAGAYFGEVVRRTFGAVHWETPSADYREHRLHFEPFTLSFNPIGIAVEVIIQGDAEDWAAHFALRENVRDQVEEALKQSTPVRETDYYTFSVRFEAIQQVTSLLSAIDRETDKPAN